MSDPNQIPEVDLSKSLLFKEAEERTGCTDWGDRSVFESALDQMLFSLEAESDLNRLGRFVTWMGITSRLKQRLLLQRHAYDRVPAEIADRPALVITGPPRTGTTLLQRLLALDPDADTLRYCDVAMPVPATRPRSKEDDVKNEEVSASLAKHLQIFPNVMKMHEMESRTPDEETFLLEYTFICALVPLRAHVPSYWTWVLETADLSALYRELKHLIAYVGQYRTGSRWVWKAPQHMWMLKYLLDGFPNAHVIWTHRDPAKSVPSMCSLSRQARKPMSDSARDRDIGAEWLEIVADGLERGMEDREAYPVRSICDVHYHDLVRNPVAAIRRIYDTFDLDFPESMTAAIPRHLAESPRGKHGDHSYTAEEFGLSAERIRERLGAYIARFHVPAEQR